MTCRARKTLAAEAWCATLNRPFGPSDYAYFEQKWRGNSRLEKYVSDQILRR